MCIATRRDWPSLHRAGWWRPWISAVRVGKKESRAGDLCVGRPRQEWAQRASFPFGHARPFRAGAALYVLGQSGDLMVVRSDDNGETWSEPARLTDKQHWHQSACNVWTANGCIYLVMERRVTQAIQSWPVGELAPVLLRGRLDADLTHRETGRSPRNCRFTTPSEHRKRSRP
jgi:hypothetical protein